MRCRRAHGMVVEDGDGNYGVDPSSKSICLYVASGLKDADFGVKVKKTD